MEVVALAIFATMFGGGVSYSLLEGQLFEDIILQLKNDFHTLENTVLNILKDREQNFKTMFVEHKTDVANEIATMKTTIARIEGNVTKAVSFSAYTPQKTTLNEGESIIFRNVLLNQGNSYNTNTGIFTVPYRGTYYFVAHVCNIGGYCATIGIMHNEAQITKSLMCDESGHASCVSASALVHGEVGDKIWLKAIYPTYLFENVHRRASFMGFFIHSD